MKSHYFLTLLIALPSIQAQEDMVTFVPPAKPEAVTYSSLWEKSPFTEKEVEVIVEGPSFAENFELQGFTSNPDTVYLIDTSSGELFTVRETEATNGITLVELKNPNNIDESSVVLASGSQLATLGFSDEKLVVAPNPAAANTTALNVPVNGQSNGTPQQQNQVKLDAMLPNNAGTQQASTGNVEKTTLSEEEMRKRRAEFWKSMRERRAREGR